MLCAGALGLSSFPAEALMMLPPEPELAYAPNAPFLCVTEEFRDEVVFSEDKSTATRIPERAFGLYEVHYIYTRTNDSRLCKGPPREDYYILRSVVYKADPLFSRITVTNPPQAGVSTALAGTKTEIRFSGKLYKDIPGADVQYAPAQIYIDSGNGNSTVKIEGRDYVYTSGGVLKLIIEYDEYHRMIERLEFDALTLDDTLKSRYTFEYYEAIPPQNANRKIQFYNKFDEGVIMRTGSNTYADSGGASASSEKDNVQYTYYREPRLQNLFGRLQNKFVRDEDGEVTERYAYLYGEAEAVWYETYDSPRPIYYVKVRKYSSDQGIPAWNGEQREYYDFDGVLYTTEKVEGPASEGLVSRLFDSTGALTEDRVRNYNTVGTAYWKPKIDRIYWRLEVDGVPTDEKSRFVNAPSCKWSYPQSIPLSPLFENAETWRKIQGVWQGERFTDYFNKDAILRQTDVWTKEPGGKKLRTIEYNEIGEILRELFYLPDGRTVADLYAYYSGRPPLESNPSAPEREGALRKIVRIRSGIEAFDEYGGHGENRYSHRANTASDSAAPAAFRCERWTLGEKGSSFTPSGLQQKTPGAVDEKEPEFASVYYAPDNQTQTAYSTEMRYPEMRSYPVISEYIITPTPIHGLNHLLKKRTFNTDGKLLLTETRYYAYNPATNAFTNVRTEKQFNGEIRNAFNNLATLNPTVPNYLLTWDHRNTGNEFGKPFASTLKFKSDPLLPDYGKPDILDIAEMDENGDVTPYPREVTDYYYDTQGTLTETAARSYAAEGNGRYTGKSLYRGDGTMKSAGSWTYGTGNNVTQQTTFYTPEGELESIEELDSNLSDNFTTAARFFNRYGMLTRAATYTTLKKAQTDSYYFGGAATEKNNSKWAEQTYKDVSGSPAFYTGTLTLYYIGDTDASSADSKITCTWERSDTGADRLTSCDPNNELNLKRFGDAILAKKRITGTEEEKVVKVIKALLGEYKTTLEKAGSSEALREAAYNRYTTYLTSALYAIEYAAHQDKGFKTDALLKGF
ncbi:MAG: hypothetical protein Greene041679_496, partial [Parcubacteria group bacterium Greene0416_79]